MRVIALGDGTLSWICIFIIKYANERTNFNGYLTR